MKLNKTILSAKKQKTKELERMTITSPEDTLSTCLPLARLFEQYA